MLKHKELLEEQLYNNFLNKNLTIILDGGISTNFIIKNAKIVISDSILFITDGQKKDLIILLDEITNVTAKNYISIEFDMINITIDY